MTKTTSGQPYRHYDDMAVLDYIDSYKQKRNGRSPSQRHIHRALNMSSASTAHNIVRRLERNKLLVLHPSEPGLAGEMEITDTGRERLEAWRAQREREAPSTPRVELHLVRGAA